MCQLHSRKKFAAPVTGVIITLAILFTFGQVVASPPHPALLEAQAAAKAAGQAFLALPSTADLHARGINTPEDCFGLKNSGKTATSSAAALGTFRILALLVDFSDHTSQVNGTYFDSMVFEVGSNTVHDYFDEISYGQIDLVTVNLPSATGWTRAPETYAYYIDGQYGMGTYPNNSQGLVTDLVDAVDGFIDFSPYDNDNNGSVDILLVIHSGTGAELSHNTNDMWSHKWGISAKATNDGVSVSTFTVQPEFWSSPGDMTIGVYSHELLHGFGLPDLYDTDNSSNGIGRWGIMSYGSWNGSLGNSPAHPCAWSRIELGITSAVNVSANLSDQAIPSVNSGGSIYRLWTSGAASNEYFLVENRQPVGYDATLPNHGLLIWHIDDAKSTNQQEWYPTLDGGQHMLVALEQADGLYELEHLSGTGDADDPWPGNLNRTIFNGASAPSSDGYLSGGSFVAVENISASAATMTADLIVGVAADVDSDPTIRPTVFTLSQNYPNPFNPSTTIEFSLAFGQEVSLKVINLLGETVCTLLDGQASAGPNTVTWDGTDDDGVDVASGIYFYRLSASEQTTTRKMMLIK